MAAEKCNILDLILEEQSTVGKSSIATDAKKDLDLIYSFTTEQIVQLVRSLQALPQQSHKVYSKISQRLVFMLLAYYKICHMIDIPIQDLIVLLEYAPYGDLLEVIEKYGNFYRIHQLDSCQVSYISGVDLCNLSTIYHQKYHRKNVERLYELGVEGIVDFCQKIHNNTITNLIYNNLLDTTLNIEEHMGNTTDSLMVDKLCDYFPFDVVYYVDENKKIYGFVRTEFDFLLEKCENPWNRSEIPTHVIIEIQKRNSMSKLFSLGKCLPMQKTLNTLLNPTSRCEDLLPKVCEITKLDKSKIPNFNSITNVLTLMVKLGEYSEKYTIPMIYHKEEKPQNPNPSASNGSRSSSISISSSINRSSDGRSGGVIDVYTDENGNIIDVQNVRSLQDLFSMLNSSE